MDKKKIDTLRALLSKRVEIFGVFCCRNYNPWDSLWILHPFWLRQGIRGGLAAWFWRSEPCKDVISGFLYSLRSSMQLEIMFQLAIQQELLRK